MKSWKYLKSMVKNVRLLLLCSILILVSSCSLSVSPTYSRDEVAKVIEKLCKDEFNLSVIAQEVNDTVWIYGAVDKLVNAQGGIDDSAIDNMRNIFLSIRRVLLSMGKPPAFYVYVISDIKTLGVDLLYIGFVPDIIKFQMGYISLGEMQEREAIVNGLNPKALGDVTGSHIEKYDIQMGEFVSYLVKQDLARQFSTAPLVDQYTVGAMNGYYYDGKLGLSFSIEPKVDTKGSVDTFAAAEKSIKKFLKIYSSYLHLVEVEIVDTTSNKRRLYSPKALFDDKLLKNIFRKK